MQTFKKQKSSRPPSSKSRMSALKTMGNEKEFYDCEKYVLTARDLHAEFYDHEILVEKRLVYIMDDFN